MIPGCSRVRRQKQSVGEVVARIKGKALEIDCRGDKNQTVDAHPIGVVQVIGQAHRPQRAIAFPGKEFRRSPPSGSRGVKANEVPNRLNILLYAIKLLRRFPRRRPTEAGADRIDENQVGVPEPREFIVDGFVGR